MFKYETFRQSVAGWFLLSSYLLFAYPYIQFDKYTSLNWLFLFLGSLLISPVIGYIVGQAVMLFFIITKLRPNERKIRVGSLHSRLSTLCDLPSTEPNPLTVLLRLPPKDLHTYLWMSCGNTELRERSESYWERYYTNINIIVVSVLGAVIACICNVPKCDLVTAAIMWKVLVLVLLTIVLWANCRRYRTISLNLENAWIDLFLERCAQDRTAIINELTKR
jgi:hypothetical protein